MNLFRDNLICLRQGYQLISCKCGQYLVNLLTKHKYQINITLYSIEGIAELIDTSNKQLYINLNIVEFEIIVQEIKEF